MISSAATRNFTSFLFISLFFSVPSYGDYGWLPRYQSLWSKIGFDYLSSNENFGSDGERVDTLYQNRIVKFTELKFWAEAEYGIAHNWSAYLKTSVNRGALESETTTTTSLPESTGLGDIYLGGKWKLIPRPVLLTLDVFSKIPPYSTQNLGADTLARGDGDFGVGFLTHAGFFAGKNFIFDLSPGFIVRSNGFNSQFLLDAMAEVIANPVFFRLFLECRWGLGKTQPASVLISNDEPGSGGTFARVSKNSDLFSGGAKFGMKLYKQYRIEVNYRHTLRGNRAPHYWQAGVNLSAAWDFFKPEKKIKIKEVPFETEQTAPSEQQED